MTSTTSEPRLDARRAQLLAAAARLFRRHGFNGVGIDDIGAAAGVSGPAIYRHFRGKQALLAAILDCYLDRFDEQLFAAGDGGGHHPQLTASVSAGLADHDGLVVYMRQQSWLLPDDLARIRDRQSGLGSGDAIAAAEGGHASRASDLLRARAAAGALISVAFAKAPGVQMSHRVARDMTQAALGAPLPPSADLATPPAIAVAGVQHVSRREAILSVATGLIRERGFRGVSLRDIGAEVGITASAVNRHFDSKDHLLGAAFHRAGEQIAGGIAVALSKSADSPKAIRAILKSYAHLAVDCRDLIVISATELHSLPQEQQRIRRRNQRMYQDELRHQLALAYPALTRDEASLRAKAAFGAVNEAVIDDRLMPRPELADELAALALAVITPAR
jgi:AcrR family transcriptional regulator